MIEVAVGCLVSGSKVLIGQRLARQSHAGQWEFPGGKLEVGERPVDALIREFQEETGLITGDWQPLINYPWDHGNIQVRLHVFVSQQFSGELTAHEGHQFEWCPIEKLTQRAMLRANLGIIRALQLPDHYMIIGEFSDQQDALQRLSTALNNGIKLVQLRAKNLSKTEFVDLAKAAVALCHTQQAKLILNTQVDWFNLVPQADGLQLASTAIKALSKRPIGKGKLLTISTHNAADLAKALQLEADFLLLSPVKETAAHPELKPLGWSKFSEIVASIPLPVYALGGMQGSDRNQAKQNGAQGVATSGYWPTGR